jgi:hypothetical protein
MDINEWLLMQEIDFYAHGVLKLVPQLNKWILVFGVMLRSCSKVFQWNIWAIFNVAVAPHFTSLMLGTLLNNPVNCILDCLATAM